MATPRKEVKDPYAGKEPEILTLEKDGSRKVASVDNAAVAKKLAERFDGERMAQMARAMLEDAGDNTVEEELDKTVSKEKQEANKEVSKLEYEVNREHEIMKERLYYSDSPYDNKKVRTAIEARSEELSFEELLLEGRVTQKVIIKDKVLEPTFISLRGKDSEVIERQLVTSFSNEYEARTWYGLARLAACTISLSNKKVLIDPYVEDKIDIELLNKKIDQLKNFSETILSVLTVNLKWFEDRLSKLLEDDFLQLKNG